MIIEADEIPLLNTGDMVGFKSLNKLTDLDDLDLSNVPRLCEVWEKLK